jgi:RNA polymerase sigma-70 factor (ECF subfamily)
MHEMNEAANSVFASSAEPAVPPALTTPDLPEGPNWTVLVTKIQAGDPAGLEQLYKMFSRGLRYFLGRQFGCQDLDDKLHDVFLAVLKAIQEGSLREPERLPGFIRTIAQRTAARHIEIRVQKRTRESEMPNTMEFADVKENPEKQAISKERAEVAKTALAQLNAHDREILLRYYVHEESQEQICAEMNLTETQFRLHKSRAKARFGEIGKKRLQKPICRRAASA